MSAVKNTVARHFYQRLAGVLIILFVAFSNSAFAQNTSSRFISLGHAMICTCGCNQILLECNHVGCTVSEVMRRELSTAMLANTSDEAVFNWFVNKYGPTVLAAPTKAGFDLVAWIMPFAVLFLGFGLAFTIIRSWKQRPLAPGSEVEVAASEAQCQTFRDQIRQETDL